MTKKLLFLLVSLLFSSSVLAHSESSTSTAHYLANEGLMVSHGYTKVVFDPLFRNSYGRYQLLPKDMEAALFAGTPPFDGIDAVFITHYHDDHFSPKDVMRLLKVQPDIRLYAPAQAEQGLREVATADDEQVFERVIVVELAYKDAPVYFEMKGLKISAVRIPHAGWPTSRLDVENISWRVTLDEATTVLHLGDADPNGVHFERDSGYWSERVTDMAFLPYWFFDSTYGPDVLANLIRAKKNIGIHVPITIATNPAARSAGLQDRDLFTKPGETRVIHD